MAGEESGGSQDNDQSRGGVSRREIPVPKKDLRFGISSFKSLAEALRAPRSTPAPESSEVTPQPSNSSASESSNASAMRSKQDEEERRNDSIHSLNVHGIPLQEPTLEQAEAYVERRENELLRGMSSFNRAAIESQDHVLGLNSEQIYRMQKIKWDIAEEEKGERESREQARRDQQKELELREQDPVYIQEMEEKRKRREEFREQSRIAKERREARKPQVVSVLTLTDEEIARMPPLIQQKVRAQQKIEQAEIDREAVVMAASEQDNS